MFSMLFLLFVGLAFFGHRIHFVRHVNQQCLIRRVPHTTRFSLCGLMGSLSDESFGRRFDQLSTPHSSQNRA